MSSSSVKTLVIVALVLINVFFLTFIVIDTVSVARNERETLENACAVVKSSGISIDPDSIKAGGELRTMRTVRVNEAEMVIARAILGQTDMTTQGVKFFYENPGMGKAEFRSGCDFDINLNEGVITSPNGAIRTAKKLLRRMKLETSECFLSSDNGNETVTTLCAYRGASIFNCMIEFLFHDGSLQTIKGKYVTGVEAAENGNGISSVGTALVTFLAAVNRGEFECSSIYGVEAGYQQSVVGPFGEGVIHPAWLISTDTGQYIIDDSSGEIRMVA